MSYSLQEIPVYVLMGVTGQSLFLSLLVVFQFVFFSIVFYLPSVLWRCCLGGRKGIRPVKTEWWGAGMVICLERGADLHMAQLMPMLLTVSCVGKIQIDFFLVPVHLGSPGQRAVKWVCVCSILSAVDWIPW